MRLERSDLARAWNYAKYCQLELEALEHTSRHRILIDLLKLICDEIQFELDALD